MPGLLGTKTTGQTGGRAEHKIQKDHFKILIPVMQTFLSKQQLWLLTERGEMLKQRQMRTR